MTDAVGHLDAGPGSAPGQAFTGMTDPSSPQSEVPERDIKNSLLRASALRGASPNPASHKSLKNPLRFSDTELLHEVTFNIPSTALEPFFLVDSSQEYLCSLDKILTLLQPF